MSKPQPQADIRGIALLEVLIALTIVAIVIGGFASVATISIDSAADGRDKMFANWVALNDITEIRLEPAPPSVGSSSDTIELSGTMWRIEREIKETPVENIRRVDVSVFLDDTVDKAALVQLSGFFGPRAPAELRLPDWSAYTPSLPGGQQGKGNPQRPGQVTDERRER